MEVSYKELAIRLNTKEDTVKKWRTRKFIRTNDNRKIDLSDSSNYDFLFDKCEKSGINPKVLSDGYVKDDADYHETPKKAPPKVRKTTTPKIKQSEEPKSTQQSSVISDLKSKPNETLTQKKTRTEIAKNKLEIEKKLLELDKVKGNLIDVASANDILNRAVTGLMSNTRDSVKQAIQSKLSDVDPDRLMDLFKFIEKEMNVALSDTLEGMLNDANLIVSELSQSVGRGQSKMSAK